MNLAEGIRRLGFRKWYERELLQSHAHLALTLLATVGVFAAFEAAASVTSLPHRLFDFGAVILCSAIGLWALRRYLYLLQHAEQAAHQAECAECHAYGRLELLASEQAGQRLTVRCKGCGHHWPMYD
jgi:hypothetical protein